MLISSAMIKRMCSIRKPSCSTRMVSLKMADGTEASSGREKQMHL